MNKQFSLFLLVILASVFLQESLARRGRQICPWIDIQNGRAKIRSKGRVAKFKCRRGFTIFDGDRFATCVRRQWNGRIPKCIRHGCLDVGAPSNGRRTYLYNKALVKFHCSPGYQLQGSPSLYCNAINWNSTAPTCTAPENPALFCDFENPGLCGWSNAQHDDFDWLRKRGPSRRFSTDTGPSADHTLQTNDGHYMFVEASIPREQGHRAFLYSPVYNASPPGTLTCFSFYYHMYGTNSGVLNGYVKPEGVSLDHLPPMLQMSGSSQNDWQMYKFNITPVHHNFQVVLEAMRARTYSDIAIDDVTLAYGSDCIRHPTMPEVRPDSSTTTTTTTIPYQSPNTTQSINVTMTTTSTNTTNSTITNTTTVPSITTRPTITTLGIPLPHNTTAPHITTHHSTATEEPKRTTTPEGAEDGEDLQSCRGRCGEIAVDEDACGCDIECGGNSTSCCTDVTTFCLTYLSTPPPVNTSLSTVHHLSTSPTVSPETPGDGAVTTVSPSVAMETPSGASNATGVTPSPATEAGGNTTEAGGTPTEARGNTTEAGGTPTEAGGTPTEAGGTPTDTPEGTLQTSTRNPARPVTHPIVTGRPVSPSTLVILTERPGTTLEQRTPKATAGTTPATVSTTGTAGEVGSTTRTRQIATDTTESIWNPTKTTKTSWIKTTKAGERNTARTNDHTTVKTTALTTPTNAPTTPTAANEQDITPRPIPLTTTAAPRTPMETDTEVPTPLAGAVTTTRGTVGTTVGEKLDRETSLEPATTTTTTADLTKTSTTSEGPVYSWPATTQNTSTQVFATNQTLEDAGDETSNTSGGVPGTIAFLTVLGTVLAAVAVFMYVRKLRGQDNLPDDSENRYLARDEVQMMDNISHLYGDGTRRAGTPV